MAKVPDVTVAQVMGVSTNAELLSISKYGDTYHATIRYDDKHTCTVDYGTPHEFYASGKSLPLGGWECTVCKRVMVVR